MIHFIRILLFQGLPALAIGPNAEDLAGVLKHVKDCGEIAIG